MNEMPDDSAKNPTRKLAEAIVHLGLDFAEYRDFIGRKKAAQILDELGIDTSGDDEFQTVITDLFGTCVTTGMTLSIRGETDYDSFDASVERLTDQLPAQIKLSFARFVPFLVGRGIEFHEDEMRPDSELLEQWGAEYKLLKSLSKPN